MTMVTLCGLTRDKRHALEALQELGVAHLEPLREPGPLEEPRSGRARRAYAALNYLRETPGKYRRSLELLALPRQIVHQEPARLFVAVISPDEPPVDLLTVPRSHVRARSLTSLREELDDLELVREEVEAERVALALDIRLLVANPAAAEDRSFLDQALSVTADRETLFAVQG